MAKIENNIFLYGVSGMIGGQIVIRQTARGPVMAVAPRKTEGREYSEAQLAQQERFRLAVMYGKGAKDRNEYRTLADSRKVSGFNVATADFLHPPEIASVDLAGYNGREGDLIEVRAVDDVAVDTVGIMIATGDNAVVEEGRMTRLENDRTLWRYNATRNAEADHVRVIVDAADLTSQVTRETEEKEI